MFLALLMLFVMGGSFCILLPWVMPSGTFIYVVWIGLTVMGLMMIWIGVLLFVMRVVMTHAHLFLPLPRANEVISIHERRGGQGAFRRGIVDVLEHIRMKDMIFKDTGGGTRVAGHRVVKTMETVNHNVPDWCAQYLYKIRTKYMVDDPKKLKELYEKLKGLKRPIKDVITIEDQLKRIPELKPVMEDETKEQQKKELLNMKIEDLQSMAEMLYNGQVIHFEDYEKFQEAAAPYDMESYSKRREIHRMMQMMHYRDVLQSDWAKYIIPICILLILGAVAYQIFGG